MRATEAAVLAEPPGLEIVRLDGEAVGDMLRHAVEKAAVEARRVPQLEQEVGKLRSQLETANGELAETRATLETERKSHAARVEELERMGVEIERKFTALAAEALGKTSENFLKLASERFEKHHANADKDLQERQKAIETLVKPLGEGLVKFESKIGEIGRPARVPIVPLPNRSCT